MSVWTIVAVAASVGKAYATYQQGMAQKAYYDSQAVMSQLQYKSKEMVKLSTLPLNFNYGKNC